MKNRIGLLVITLFVSLSASTLQAQLLIPENPTSADNLKLSYSRACSNLLPYKANAYRVRMAQNNITVELGEIVPGIVGVCPPAPRDEIDLGRLPAGSYTFTVIEAASGSTPSREIFSNLSFTVTDARAAKTAPYVRLDYSGHWWDPNDSGWGLFIWHDARDNVLAAWFTYTPDGKPMWYVFQPGWQTSSATRDADLMQTIRPPGATSPPPTAPTSIVIAGKASLDFTNFGTVDEGKLTYTFTGGPTLVRNIKRFKP